MSYRKDWGTGVTASVLNWNLSKVRSLLSTVTLVEVVISWGILEGLPSLKVGLVRDRGLGNYWDWRDSFSFSLLTAEPRRFCVWIGWGCLQVVSIIVWTELAIDWGSVCCLTYLMDYCLITVGAVPWLIFISSGGKLLRFLGDEEGIWLLSCLTELISSYRGCPTMTDFLSEYSTIYEPTGGTKLDWGVSREMGVVGWTKWGADGWGWGC